ncbi:benzoate-CoA ligase family protein [Alkalinema pantanalense CENA528]|uniref:benzoate-CoA ligase family protein n=1 Tax=Alkalinema pantanalense TaxID=1620705 RepID=UPI003D6DBC9C
MESLSARLPKTFNVAAYFLELNLAANRSDKVAFYTRDAAYTYGQVAQLVRRSAKLLTNLGLEREQRLAILLPDTPEFVFAFWGAIWAGIIPVPINTACSVAEIQYILQNSRAKVLLTTQAWLETLAPIPAASLRHGLTVDGAQPFLMQIAQQDDQMPWAQTDREEPAFWLYTSGSTGNPKGVVHLHQSMVICAESYGKAVLGLQEDDIVYSVAKMPFAYGLGNTLYMPMAVGASSVLSDAVNAFDVIADIQTHRPTVFFGIPGLYAGMLALHELAPLDPASLRLCVSAAEQLPKTLWSQWRDRYGLEICEGIGTTELLHIFLSNRPGECRPGSSGRPIPGYDVQIVDDAGCPLPPGEVGALQVTGESLMLGYWNRLQATRDALYGCTMRTGDQYLQDVDGYFWFMGRNNDFVKVNGMWVSPFEIEDVLLQHESILDAAIVPEFATDETLTQIVAYVSLKAGFQASPILEKQIAQWVKTQLPHFKAPRMIHFLDHLPRTATGKVHRKALSQHQSSVTDALITDVLIADALLTDALPLSTKHV